MGKISAIFMGICLIALLAGSGAARDVANSGLRPVKAWSNEEFPELIDPGLRGLYEVVAVDTYCIVWYTFEQMNWQGWTRSDETAQRDTFFRVDDFAGLGGGSYGGLVPLEGTKSMWCGARPNLIDPYMCSWLEAPGYGNSWNQILGTAGFSFVGSITLSFKAHYDSEPDNDFTRVEYDAGGGNWKVVAEYTGAGDTVASCFIALTQARTKLRFHFTSDRAWSDQDGLWNTDGGCIIDSIRVVDNAVLDNYENFESAAIGATTAGIWIGTPEVSYGSYAGLKTNLIDKDPCGDNFGTQVVFFIGSPNPSSSYPGLYDTPFCMGPGGLTAPCQNELIISPIIDMTKYSTACNNVQDGTIPAGELPLLGGTILRFSVYQDLPFANLVFYQWHVRSIVSGCPGQWLDDNYLYYGSEQAYIRVDQDVSSFIGGDDPVQIGMGCVDMCDVWYNCADHRPSPWIDNVTLYHYKTTGPQWSYRDIDLFHDNFPGGYDIEGYVRVDAAIDINPPSNPVIRPGDSIVLYAASPAGGGIAEDPGGGPAVYLHVWVHWVGGDPSKPDISGSILQGTYGKYLRNDGEWTVLRCDTARTKGGIAPNKYMIDIADSVLTRGYILEYYFSAKDAAGNVTYLSSNGVRKTVDGILNVVWVAAALPTHGATTLVVVKKAFGIGLFSLFIKTVLDIILPEKKISYYRVSTGTPGVSDGLASRAKAEQLCDAYETIIVAAGDGESFTLGDGTVNSSKSDDCTMLVDWMAQSQHACGLWICSDDVAYDLNNLASTQAINLMNNWCGVDFVAKSYFDVTGGRSSGGIVTPLITGSSDAGVFVHGGVPDKFYAYGGCPIINQFDVLEKTANGKYALSYPNYQGTNYYAGIAAENVNAGGYPVRTMWFGFSYMNIRDDVLSAPMDRVEIARDVFDYFGETTNIDITPADAPKPTTKLTQNFPNPFNPATTIKYSVKDKGLVTIRVYSVAGQLVRTLVDGVKDAGYYAVTWDGKNDRDGAVASGIYFYRMDTKGFSETKKIVLLR
ncbi:MAG: T9SS type A sorting domain-containing protein [Candidatus Krumholzibacteria bacterium]|nr:T9SS type A sorting domain-containing protein [Candidatus Krumholzibacteria bacterium]